MHSSDIRNNLAHFNLSACQDAFRALITGEDIIEGVEGGPDDAAELLQRLAEALGQDASSLPDDVAESIDGLSDGGFEGSTYAAGAAAVLAAMPRFKDVLAARYPEPIQGE